MNKRKRILAGLCLVLGLAQAPANAQATGAELLVPLVARLLPIVVPLAVQVGTIAVSSGIMAVSAGSRLPAYVKERMSEMNLPGRRRRNQSVEGTANAVQEKTESTAHSGKEAEEGKATVAAAPATSASPAAQTEPAVKLSAKPAAEAEQQVEARTQPRATESGEWFLPDEKELKQAAHHRRKVSESVKGEVLESPPEAQEIHGSSDASDSASESPREHEARPAVIMMKVED